MKRLICVSLLVSIVLSFTACASNVPSNTPDSNLTSTGNQKTDENSQSLGDEELKIATDALDAIDAFLDGTMKKYDASSKIKSCSKSFEKNKTENPNHLSVSMNIQLVESSLALYEAGADTSDLLEKRNALASSIGANNRQYGKWNEVEPTILDGTSFSGTTETDTVDFIGFQVPSSWQKKHEQDSKYTYYYPFEDTTKTFIMIQTAAADYDFSTMDDVAYNKLWPDYIEGIIRGMQSSDSMRDLVVSPCIVNGNRIALIQGEYSSKSASGAMYNAIFTSHKNMINVACLLADPDKNINIDDYFALLCSTTIIGTPASADPQASASMPENNSAKYSANGITVNIGQPKYDKSWGGYYYTDLTIKNDSTSDIYYEVEYVKVNGFQLPVLSFGDVYSGMSSNTQVSFSTDDMRLARIDHILDIELQVRIMESDSKRLIDTTTLSLTTSDAGKYTQSYEFGWQEVYNQNGLRICARLGESGESYPAIFFIENSSGKTVSLSFNDIAINSTMTGQMMTGAQVVNGARSVTGMQRALLEMMGGDIPENRDINSIVLKFSFLPISDDGGFSTANLYYSDKITISR